MKKRLFDRLAMFLYQKACMRKIPFSPGRQVEADLRQLHPGESLEEVKTVYYVRKLSLVLKLAAVGSLLAAGVGVSTAAGGQQEGGSLQRAGPGEANTEIQVETSYGESAFSFRIQLAARQLGEEEAMEQMKELLEALPGYILGENESLETVTSDLALRERYEPFPVTVAWESSCPEAVDSAGSLRPGKEEQEVTLRAMLSCGEYALEGTIGITVPPESLSEEERAYRELEEYLLKAEEESRQEESMQLPDAWNGTALTWSLKKERKALLLWGAFAAAAVITYFFSDRDLHEKLEKRKKALQAAYPDLIHELVLLVGAGMTTRGAFQKMAADYEKKKPDSQKENPAYEEILHMCREMQSGVSEGAAYERLGKRTGLRQYIRLSSLLTQNLKRGNSSLPERLREEAFQAGEERLQRSRKLGEEAGTRLLAPMVMMLAVVMTLIMIPAFMGL